MLQFPFHLPYPLSSYSHFPSNILYHLPLTTSSSHIIHFTVLFPLTESYSRIPLPIFLSLFTSFPTYFFPSPFILAPFTFKFPFHFPSHFWLTRIPERQTLIFIAGGTQFTSRVVKVCSGNVTTSLAIADSSVFNKNIFLLLTVMDNGSWTSTVLTWAVLQKLLACQFSDFNSTSLKGLCHQFRIDWKWYNWIGLG